jgi:hypothetical protein
VVVKKISEGVIPFGQVSPPFRLTEDNHAEVVPEQVPIVTEALRMRADDRAPINTIRAYLAEHGIDRSYNGVVTMLSNPMLIGELHFGKTERTKGGRPGRLRQKLFDPVVDPDLYRRAQSTKALPGRRAKSERLLARLGVLRCANCDARMVVGSSNHGTYWVYRCPPNGDCDRHVTVSATLVEDMVVSEVRRLLADVEGAASAEAEVREAEADLRRKQAALDAAIHAFTGLETETAAVERLAELAADRDAAQKRVDSLSGSRTALTVTVEDWDRLTLAERRGLIQATIARVTVAPGHGPSRITVEPFRGE